MYENKLIHRDIKLQNILFKYNNKEKTNYIFKLIDFGISKHLLSLTQKLSTKIGTFNMMTPEIIEGKPYNEKCDLWSLGIIIYLLYFHKYPYNGNNEFAILNQIKALNQKILTKTKNLDLDDLISKLLNSNPNKRITWGKYFEHPFFNKKKNEYKSSENEEKLENKKEKEKEVRKFQEIKKGITESLEVVLLGDSGVDKTKIIGDIVNYPSGTSFCIVTLEFPELESSITFEIWDTADQEKFRNINELYYKTAKVFILVYDITNKYSFESIKDYWYKEVENYRENNPILAVVANKIELFDREEVDDREAHEFAKEIGAIFQFTSSANNWGINELFHKIGEAYLKEKAKMNMKLDIKKEKTFNKKKCIII